MKRAHHGWFRVLASACLWAAAAGCHDLFNLDEHPQTFVDPASYFKTGDQAIAAVNRIYQPLMTWDGWLGPGWQAVTCAGPDVLCLHWRACGYRGRKTGTWLAVRIRTSNFSFSRRPNAVH